ncbi:MAG: hypothetical protein AB1815_05930 [Bacillota bacterium]
MNKYIKVIIITLLAILTMGLPAYGNPNTALESARKAANTEIEQKLKVKEYFTTKNESGKPLSETSLKGWGVLSYGEAHGDVKTYKGNPSRRYLGYTWSDVSFTNPSFPVDEWTGGFVEDKNWLIHPWNDKDVEEKLLSRNEKLLDLDLVFNSPRAGGLFLKNIQEGLKHYYGKGPVVDGQHTGQNVLIGESSPYWNKWHEYVYILSPPTDYTWGMGRMWNKRTDGSIWYMSVPLAPNIMEGLPDFYTKFDKPNVSADPSESIELVVTFGLKPGHSKDEIASLKVFHVVGNNKYPVNLEPIDTADALNPDDTIVFTPGQERKYRVTKPTFLENNVCGLNHNALAGQNVTL